jgi:DNA-directed RNA polymerase specialized sigma24 family protein
MNTLTTSFVRRLRDRDETAWFELWEIFGPVLRAQLTKWGRGRIGVETVRDLTQETLAALSDSIDRFDPSRGARFSTWLLSIAKHALGDEIDRRMALKRGSGRRPTEFDERFMGQTALVRTSSARRSTPRSAGPNRRAIFSGSRSIACGCSTECRARMSPSNLG